MIHIWAHDRHPDGRGANDGAFQRKRLLGTVMHIDPTPLHHRMVLGLASTHFGEADGHTRIEKIHSRLVQPEQNVVDMHGI